MQIQSIKEFLKDPFKAFVVRTASGEGHVVMRPDGIALSPKGDLVVLWPTEGGIVFLDVDQITQVFFRGRKRG